MKRLFIVTLITVMGFSTGIVANASADSIQGKSAVGVNLMYVMPGSTDVSLIDPDTGTLYTSSVEPDSAVGFGLSYTYGLTKDWALELTLDRSAHDFKDAEMEIALTTLIGHRTISPGDIVPGIITLCWPWIGLFFELCRFYL